MIGRLQGRIVHEEPDGAVTLDVGGVGYDLTTPVGCCGRAQRTGDTTTLHVHTHVREEALELFGFASTDERRVFRLLLRVPNVGPKTALGVLSALPVDEIGRAVRDGNAARLAKVPGIGKRTAERIVLELQTKLAELQLDRSAPIAPGDGDAAAKLVIALSNMGYKSGEADRAVRALGDRVGAEPLSQLLREALAHLTP